MLTTLLLLGLAAEPPVASATYGEGVASATYVAGVAPAADDPEIVVTASLGPVPRGEAPATLTVIDARRIDALGELNVIEQARNVCQTTIVQDAWARGQELVVHGWFYGLLYGLLHDLQMTVASAADMAGAYDAALAAVQRRHATPVAVDDGGSSPSN